MPQGGAIEGNAADSTLMADQDRCYFLDMYGKNELTYTIAL
jgi:hypothetical protein